MNVLSLFDGLACGLIALKRAKIKVDNYFASEIDKYAIQIAKKNHPEIKQIGDIKKINIGALGKIDLILAGPPCQGFSCSGSRLDFDDPRSLLFFKAIEILWDIQKINPDVKFLIENVSSMRKDTRAQLSELLEIESVEINSNLVSAQNRSRVYWTNLPKPGQPKDKGIFLRDILESKVSDKYHLHKNSISGKSTLKRVVDSLRYENEKAKSLLSEQGFTKIGNTCLIEKVTTMPIGKRSIKHLVDGLRFENEKSKALTSTGARNISGSNSTCLIIQTSRGKNKGGIKAINGKTPTLSSKSWVDNNHLFEMIRRNGDEKTFIKVNKKLKRKPDQTKASTLTCGANSGGNHSAMDLILRNDFSFRRLTPIECERLQTLPDNYTEGVSNTQRYKMIGNGWTVDVIKHIFKFMGTI